MKVLKAKFIQSFIINNGSSIGMVEDTLHDLDYSDGFLRCEQRRGSPNTKVFHVPLHNLAVLVFADQTLGALTDCLPQAPPALARDAQVDEVPLTGLKAYHAKRKAEKAAKAVEADGQSTKGE